jgi:hypothetical protein
MEIKAYIDGKDSHNNHDGKDNNCKTKVAQLDIRKTNDSSI